MILALRALGVGDLVASVPALRALRRACPGETLALAAPRWLAPLVDLVGGIDRLVPLDGLDDPTALALRASAGEAPGPRLAVNLHGRGPQSHRLLLNARPGRLLGFACPEAGHTDGPRWRENEHEVTRWCRLLTWYGIQADRAELAMRPPPGDFPTGLTIVHPGAKAPARRWPPRRFGAVAQALAAAGHRVVVTGSTAERRLAGAVARAAGLPPDAVLAGRTDTAELAGLVAGARLVISGDTGIAHLATAYGTPSVVLFGPISPALWGPPPDRPWHRALWHGDRADQSPGTEHSPSPDRAPHPALLAITPAEVLAAVPAADSARRSLPPVSRPPVSRPGRRRGGLGSGARIR